MFCTLVHADCKNAILRRIQENGKIYRGSLCFITVHVFLLLLFCCWLQAVFVILLTSWKSLCYYFFQFLEMHWKAIFRKRIVICTYLFRRFYHFDSVKRFFLSAFFVFIRLRSAYYRNKSTDIVYMYTQLYVFFQTGRYKQNACYGIGKILFRMKVENGKW